MSSIYGMTGSLALTANTANQLVFGIGASSTDDGIVSWLDITMDAATPAQGVKLEMVRYTGGIPSATAYTANRLTAAAQSVGTSMSAWAPPITATPTGPTVVDTWYFSPAGGASLQWPLSREYYLATGATVWTGLRASTAAGVSPNLAFNVKWGS